MQEQKSAKAVNRIANRLRSVVSNNPLTPSKPRQPSWTDDQVTVEYQKVSPRPPGVTGKENKNRFTWNESRLAASNISQTLIDSAFEELLCDLQIDDPIRAKMRVLDPAVKSAMIKGRQDHPFLKGMTNNQKSPIKVKSVAHLKRRSVIDQVQKDSGPSTWVSWLQITKYQNIDLEQMKKLRVLLRNESLTWIMEFFSSGGYNAIWGKLEDLLDLEWREEQHDDRLLYELLRCLKGLSTTEIGRKHLLSNMNVFERLTTLLFSEKQPGELLCRGVIVELLITLIHIHPSPTPESGAYRLLRSLLVPKTDNTIVDFVAQAHKPRIYKKWVTEMSRIANDHFWIFVHAENGFIDFRIQDEEWIKGPKPPEPMTGGVEFEAIGYLTHHMVLLNAYLQICCPTKLERLDLYDDLAESGFDRMLLILRRCSQRYYPEIHYEMARYLAWAKHDGWPIDYIVNAPRTRARKPQGDHSYQAPAPAMQSPPPELQAMAAGKNVGQLRPKETQPQSKQQQQQQKKNLQQQQKIPQQQQQQQQQRRRDGKSSNSPPGNNGLGIRY